MAQIFISYRREGRKRRESERARFFLLVLAVSLSLTACSQQREPVSGEAAPAQTEAPMVPTATECDMSEPRCSVTFEGDGDSPAVTVQGRCIAGWCIPTGSGCIHDVECLDDNPCTRDRCVTGGCVAEPIEGSCETTEVTAGVCERGICEEPPGGPCEQPADCPSPRNLCVQSTCTAQGTCSRTAEADDTTCRTLAGAPGACGEGHCQIQRAVALERDADCARRRGRVYPRRGCGKGTKYLLDDETLTKERQKISRRIEREVRYDIFASLVELPDGGYNIVTTNLRSRKEVRGLMDPSFVAFTIAQVTGASSWRSRNLLIWLDAGTEGWIIPTGGSRKAMAKGKRAAGVLGQYGVVNVQAYRKWLEATFRPLEPATPQSGEP